MVLLLKCFFRWVGAFVLFAFIAASMSYFGAIETINEDTFQRFFDGEIQFWFYTFLLFIAGVALISLPLPFAKYALKRYIKGGGVHHLIIENLAILFLATLPVLVWHIYNFPINEVYMTKLIPLYLLCFLLFLGRFKRIALASKQD